MGKSRAWLNQLSSQQSGVRSAVQAPEQNQRHSGVGERLQIPRGDTEVEVVLLFLMAQGI